MRSRSRCAIRFLTAAIAASAAACGRLGVEGLVAPASGGDGGSAASRGEAGSPTTAGGASGASGAAGNAGASMGDAGTGATAGVAGILAGGAGAGAVAGSAGSGGSAGGTAGLAGGCAGAAATGGEAATAGTAGLGGGPGGVAGQAGRGGVSGTAGVGPQGGTSAAGGSAGWTGVAGASGSWGMVPLGPDLRLLEGGADLACGLDSYAFAPVDVGSASGDVAFELANEGDQDLDLVGAPQVEIITADPSEFTVTASPSTPIGPGTSTEFRIAFSPHWTGPRQATVVIASNDPDESPCRLALEGSGLPVGGPDNGAWQTASTLSTGRYGLGAAISGGFLYVVGGFRQRLSLEIHDEVEYAPLNPDGTVGAFTLTTALPAATARFAIFAYNGYLFVAGGAIDTDSTTTDVVRVAPLQADGSVGTWTTTISLPSSRRGARAVVHGGIVYLVGGRTESGAANEVLLGRLEANGTVATWEPTSPLLYDRLHHGVAVVDGRLYAIAGWDSGGVQQNESAVINADGTLSTWTETTSVPEVRSSGTSFAYGNYVYCVAGDDGSTLGMHGDGVFAPVNADGTLGTWSTLSNDFSQPRTGARALVYESQLLLVGGWNQLLSNYDDLQRAPLP